MSLNNESMERSVKDKDFHKYQHIIRLGEPEVEGILNGTVYCFPKLDGTQRQMYKYGDEIVIAGHDGLLPEANDNGSNRFLKQKRFERFFEKYPNLRLFGEYLIPHSLRFYKTDAWGKFYIFDVAERIGEDRAGQSIWGYLTYEQYVPMLEEFGIDYIELAAKFENPTREDIIKAYEKSGWLTEENQIGEGFVLKNYDFRAYNGRTLWAKVVWREIPEIKVILDKTKQNYSKIMQALPVEQKILNDYMTTAFIEKEYHKILEVVSKEDRSFEHRLFNGIYKTLLEEEIYHIVKKYGNPKIDFKTLKDLCDNKIKLVIHEIEE